jgi:hypothetical protein
MRKWLKFGVALLCLVCFVVICIAPDLDLPDTTLRAKKLTVLLLLAIVALASVITGRSLALRSRSNTGFAPSQSSHFEWFLPKSERNFVFLCQQIARLFAPALYPIGIGFVYQLTARRDLENC